jgi:hypothetical protein
MHRKPNPDETRRQGAAPAKQDSRKKKLTVRREMLRTLDGDLLREAAGGLGASFHCPTW